MKSGIIYVKVRLQLNQDLTEEEAQELVSEMDYEFKDEAGLIENVEITSTAQCYSEDLI